MTTTVFKPLQVFVIPTLNGMANVIKRVVWEMEISSNGQTTKAVGEIVLPDPNPETYIETTEVTSEILKGWVMEANGGDLYLQQLLMQHEYYLEDLAVLAVAEPYPALEVTPVLTTEQIADAVRLDRNTRLHEADTLVNKALDNGVDPGMYRAYRQALRDIPEQAGFPTDVSWPVAPPDPS